MKQDFDKVLKEQPVDVSNQQKKDLRKNQNDAITPVKNERVEIKKLLLLTK